MGDVTIGFLELAMMLTTSWCAVPAGAAAIRTAQRAARVNELELE
jgi:hypothetical protein